MSSATPIQPHSRTTADVTTALPTQAPQRFRFLDFLRGVALLGILPENMPYFALPIAGVEDALKGVGLSTADHAAVLIIRTFGDYKFLSMFSLMFGVGLALIYQRCRASGRPFRPFYRRRLLLLFVFGVLHGTLLWYGDILALYAIGGFAAMWAVSWRPVTLRRAGLILIAVPFVALLIGGAFEAAEMQHPPSAFQPVDASALRPATTSSAPADSRLEQVFGRIAARLEAENETAVYREGRWTEILILRLTEWVVMLLFMLLYMEWRIVGLFLIGISFMKQGWFVRPAQHRREFARLLVFGLIVGVPLQLAATCYPLLGMIESHGGLLPEAFQYGGSLGMAAIYVWLFSWLFVRFGERRWTSPIVAVGRSALTNYILMSVIANFIFYSYGLGQFGELSRVQLLAIVPVIWTMCLLLSTFWMSRFQFGPLEWIWRRLTYGGTLAMRESA